MNGIATYGQPLEQRRAGQIQVLPEEILVERRWCIGVTPNSEGYARIQDEVRITPAQDRGGTHVKHRVICIAGNNGQSAGYRELTTIVA